MKIKYYSAYLFAIFLVVLILFPIGRANAAALTAQSIVLSNPAAAAVNDIETIQFTSTGAIPAATGTITITYPGAWTGITSLTAPDITMYDNGSALPAVIIGSPTGAQWGVALATTTITFTNGNAAILAGHTVKIVIGLVSGHYITNPTAGSYTITLATTSDTGQVTPVFGNNIIAVSASVAQSMTFTVSGSVALNTLTATSTQSGTSTMTAATNASGGMSIVVTGTTLTSNAAGSPTIAACTGASGGNACVLTASSGAGSGQGNAQFGMNLVSKEFVAARSDESGVLILSQFTGASRELKDSLIIESSNY